MIDYKDYLIFKTISPRVSKKFGGASSSFFYDKRIKTTFKKIYSAPSPLTKYYFTDTTMARVKPMDLSKCYPTKLGWLYEKYGQEVGICLCKEHNLGFAYVISATSVQLIVTSGRIKHFKSFTDIYKRTDDSALYKALVGACVINYDSNTVDILSTSIFRMIHSSEMNDLLKDTEIKQEVLRLKKELDKMPNGMKLSEANKREYPSIYNAFEDENIKKEKIWTAIKMFIFLKTAKSIEKYFMSESKIYRNKAFQSGGVDNDIIIVNSNWDSSINVVNPFAVSGHFRNQPRKNKNNEWYKQLIYIDAFIKTGYKRKAGILSEIK